MSYTNTAYAEGMTWQDVPAHSTTETSITVGYNTGIIRTGQDYWWVQYTLPDGTVWISPGTIVETLHVKVGMVSISECN